MSMCEWSVLTPAQQLENLVAVVRDGLEQGPHQRECLNTRHDHAGVDMNGDPTGEAMRCNDCEQRCHYDDELEDYRHDEMWARPCFLIPYFNECPTHHAVCDGYGNCAECESERTDPLF